MHPDDARDGESTDARLEALLADLFATADDPTDRALLDLFHRDVDRYRSDHADVVLVTEGDPELVGVRSASLIEERQLVAESNGVTIVIDMVRRTEGDGVLVDISGEVIGVDEVLSVQVIGGDTEFGLTTTDAWNEFRLRGIPAGPYLLILSGSQGEISVDVELR